VIRILICFSLITASLLITSIFANSALLFTEFIHSLVDLIPIAFAFYALRIIDRIDSKYTYGLHRLEIVSSLFNIFTVVAGSVFSVYISTVELIEGSRGDFLLVLISSSIALSLSLVASTDKSEEGRVSGSKLHAIQDSLAYILAVISSLLIIIMKIYFIDPVSAYILNGVLVITSLSPLKFSYNILMEKSPIDTKSVETELQSIFPQVHHIHVWSICDHLNVATLHVRENPDLTLRELDKKREYAEKVLREKFGITHVTIQFEANNKKERLEKI